MNEHSSKYKQPDFKYYVKPNTSCYDYYTFQDLEEACIRAKTLSLTEFPVSLLYEPIETEDGWRMKEIFIYMKGRAIASERIRLPCNRNCLLQGTCLEMAKEFARHFTKFIALPLSEDSRKYLSRYIELTDDILLAIGKHAMRFQIPCEICAHYTDMEDFFSDWTALGYSRTEARKLMHGGIGEFMKLPAGAGYVRFAL